MKEYVLGFAFWRDQVALIWKTKGPEYVINTWNGIGGKVEEQDETFELAMMREFAEETGLVILPWHRFAVQSGTSWDGGSYSLHCFVTLLPEDQEWPIENTEEGDEEVAWFEYCDLDVYPKVTPNLKWLIPLALDKTTGFLDITEK